MNKKLVIIGIIAIFSGLVLITISQNTMAAQTRTVDPQIRNAYPLFGCSGNQASEPAPNRDTRTEEGIEAEMCEITDPELAFIEERLRMSRRLSKQWGIIDQDYCVKYIRRVALCGMPDNRKQCNIALC